MLIDSASCSDCSHGVVETENKRLLQETYELPNNLRLMILGNEVLLKLFTWVFIDLINYWTRGFDLTILNFNSCF